MVNFVFLHKFLRGFFYRLLFLKMPVPVFWSREDVKALIVVWKDEKIQEQIGSGKKRNTHVHRRIFLSIFLPQLTTNLELTPKLCGQELGLPIAIRIPIKMALPCKRNSRSGSRSGSTYPDRNPENFVPCKRSIRSMTWKSFSCAPVVNIYNSTAITISLIRLK